MRILVCGDRNWTDADAIRRKIVELGVENIECVVEGEARGADSHGRRVAESLNIPVLKFPAKWQEFGRAAGAIRNRQMLVEGKPDLVLAFHDDLSKSVGTANMVWQARKARVKVWMSSEPGA